jgi:transcriptional regulator with XRE-family HTH domain
MTEMPIRIAQTLTQRVAAEVRAEVARQAVTQERVAGILGVAQPNVSRRLNGKQPFDTDELDKLADAFGVPVDRFLSAPASIVGAA